MVLYTINIARMLVSSIGFFMKVKREYPGLLRQSLKFREISQS